MIYLLNGCLQINIKMKKLKFILGILVVLIILAQISLINSQNIIDLGKVMGLPEEIKIIGIGVKYQELEDNILRVSFVEENATLDVNGNVFTNIIPQNISGHPTYVDLDEDNVVKADFTVGKNGGTYTFGDKTINASANSRVFFDEDTGIGIKFPDGADLTNFEDLLEYIQKGYITEIKGEDILLPNGIFLNGELQIKEEGYFLKQGTADYEEMRLNVDDEKDGVLIANLDADLSDYKGNWIRQDSDILEMQSAEKSFIDVEFLEGHEILNTDGKDLLTVNINSGDGLRFEKRTDKGLIPKVIHKSSENGKTIFENDKFEIVFDKNEISGKPPAPLEYEDFDKKYQSVAFELESDSPEIDTKIRMNSYRQFVFLDKNDKELVSYNKYGLPVSALIEDNKLQTMEQMREKYPSVEFKTVGLIPRFNESNIPPYLLYLTDNFFEGSPKAIEYINMVEYHDVATAGAGGQTIEIGRPMVDPTSEEYALFPMRDMASPIDILRHELEHLKDDRISNEEIELLKTLGNEELNELLKKLKIYEEKILKGDYDPFSDIEERQKIKDEINKIIYYDMGPKRLTQIYNEIALESLDRLYLNEEFTESIKEMMINARKEEQIIERIKKISENNFGKDIISVLIEFKYNDINSEEEALKLYEENIWDFGGKAIFALRNLNIEKKFILSEEKYNELNDLGIFIREGEYWSEGYKKATGSGFGTIEDKIRLYAELDETYVNLYDAKFKKEVENIDWSVNKFSGLPYEYALFNYRSLNYEPEEYDPAIAEFLEVSSLWVEKKKEERKKDVNSANPLVSNTAKRLTQLSFDSGKIDVGEYKYVMGEEHCKDADCSDKLCVEYKLLCCEMYPNSPNCPD